MIPYLLTASEEEETLARGVADVGSLQVAKVYAEALLNAANQAGEADAVLADYQALLETIEKPRSELRNFFVSGVVGRITRGETLRKVFDERAHALLVNFLLVLNDHERLPLLPAILFEARQLQDERANRLPVHVHSATPLSDDQLKRIGDQIKQSMKLDPILENNVDPELLGGVLIRIGDFVFDGSIRTRLEQIRDQILSRGSYEIQSGRDRFSTAVGN